MLFVCVCSLHPEPTAALRRMHGTLAQSRCGLAVQPGSYCADESNCLFDCDAGKVYVWNATLTSMDEARDTCGKLNFWRLAGATSVSAPRGMASLVCYNSYEEQLAVERWFFSRRAPMAYWIGLRIQQGAAW
jgi:hypothetical protein